MEGFIGGVEVAIGLRVFAKGLGEEPRLGVGIGLMESSSPAEEAFEAEGDVGR